MKTAITIAFLSGFLIGALVAFVGLKNWADNRARREVAEAIETIAGAPSGTLAGHLLQEAENLREEARRRVAEREKRGD